MIVTKMFAALLIPAGICAAFSTQLLLATVLHLAPVPGQVENVESNQEVSPLFCAQLSQPSNFLEPIVDKPKAVTQTAADTSEGTDPGAATEIYSSGPDSYEQCQRPTKDTLASGDLPMPVFHPGGE